MKLMAIDPGLKGGIAIFDDPGSLMTTWPMLSLNRQYGGRGKKHRLVNLPWLLQMINDFSIGTVVLEVPTAMPRQSSVATATTFTNWGLLLSLEGVKTERTPPVTLHFVYPGMWKKHYGLDKNKTRAVKHACELLGLPLTYKSTDGEAEAALIGHYWRTGGSERERAHLELQKSRPRRRKKKASAPKRRAARPRASSPAPPSHAAAPART
jgi:hypothetical protein